MLGKRLNKVAEYVDGSVADIGSDHAYLPISLIERGQIKRAIVGEVVEGPYKAAVNNILNHQLQEVIDARLGSGLSILEQGETECITICGMGGPLISEILIEGHEKLSHYPKLILQSNIHTEKLRRTLNALGYKIIIEDLVKERRHIYEIIVAVQGDEILSDIEYKFGKMLNYKEPLFIEKWMREYNHLVQVYEAIKNKENTIQTKKLSKQLNQLREVLNIEH